MAFQPTKEIERKLEEAGIKTIFDRFIGPNAKTIKTDCRKYFRDLPGNNTLDDNAETGLMTVLRAQQVGDADISEFSVSTLRDSFTFVEGPVDDEYKLLEESEVIDDDDDDDDDEPMPTDTFDEIDEEQPSLKITIKRPIDDVADDEEPTPKKAKKGAKTKKKKK